MIILYFRALRWLGAIVILGPTFSINRSRTIRKKKGKLTRAMLCLSCRTFSPQSVMSWQTKLGFWRGWESGGGPPRPVRDEKSCLRPWFVAWKFWSDGVVHCKPYADWLFYLALNSKMCRVPEIYPRLYLLKKNRSDDFFSSYSMYVLSTFEIR